MDVAVGIRQDVLAELLIDRRRIRRARGVGSSSAALVSGGTLRQTGRSRTRSR
jgi:hypothetical protein